MKRILCAIAFSCFFAFSGNATIQEDAVSHDPATDKTMPDENNQANGQFQNINAASFLNIAKINVSSFVVKTISLQYERVLTPKISACLGLRLTPKGGLPFSGMINSMIEADDEDEETEQFIKDMRLGGWAITPELRYYLGKGYGKGFYVSLFGRYERFSLNSVYPFKDDNNVTTNIAFDGHYSSTGIGLMIGSQFMLGNRLTLDWWILGPYYARPKVELSGSGFNLSDDDRQQLQESLDGVEIDFASFKTKSVVTNTTANVKIDGGSVPLLRGFGLCLGVRF